MGEPSPVAVHGASVAAVAAWMVEALESMRLTFRDANTTTSSATTAAHVAAEEFTRACIDRGIAHATAVACTDMWIQDALTHHHRTLPATDAAITVSSPVHVPAAVTHDHTLADCQFSTRTDRPCAPANVDADADAAEDVYEDEDIDALRSLATAIAADAVHSALRQVATLMQLGVKETEEKMADVVVATGGPSTITQEQFPIDQETQSEQPQVVESFSPPDETQTHRTEAARRYVSSLVDSTLLRHVCHPSQSAHETTTPTTTTQTTLTNTPSLPELTRTPTPPPAPKPKSPPHEILVVSTETVGIAEPPEATVGVGGGTVVVLAAVKPPTSGLRSHSQNRNTTKKTATTTKKTATTTTKVNSLPKTADAQLVSKPVVVGPRRRAPRPSKQPTALPATGAVDESDQDVSPPRLRKLEEYLAMDPVGRATQIYHRPHAPRPNQQLQKQQPKPQQQLPSLCQSSTSPNSGYDAESDDDQDDHDDHDDTHSHQVIHNSRSLTKIRPAPVFPPSTTTTTSTTTTSDRTKAGNGPGTGDLVVPVAKHTTAVVDRPDRLGLLNKPKKRSGFCQQCTFQGKSCKISDCLKHQPLLLR